MGKGEKHTIVMYGIPTYNEPVDGPHVRRRLWYGHDRTNKAEDSTGDKMPYDGRKEVWSEEEKRSALLSET